jgi:hypothetical protein
MPVAITANTANSNPPMNPEAPNPNPQTPRADSAYNCRWTSARLPSESGCGILPQTVQGASSSVDIGPHPPAHSFRPAAFDDLGFVYPPEMHAEPDFDFDDDNEVARERELLLDDLASDADDFTRSDENGWFYSDED